MKYKRHLKIISSLCISLVLLTICNAQTKSQNITTQTATTKDGRIVVLKSDGTWVYQSSPSVTSSSSILSFDTGVVFKSGDVKPIARGTFYLLDDSIENKMKKGGFQPPKDYTIHKFLTIIYYGRETAQFSKGYESMMRFLQVGAIAKTTTDFNGKATFPPVPSGTYYIFGVHQISKNVVLWDSKVDLKAGLNYITLDQNNAAEIF